MQVAFTCSLLLDSADDQLCEVLTMNLSWQSLNHVLEIRQIADFTFEVRNPISNPYAFLELTLSPDFHVVNYQPKHLGTHGSLEARYYLVQLVIRHIRQSQLSTLS